MTPLDRDAVASEEPQRIEQERQAGATFFIGQYFRIGQSGMIVDGQMEILPADAATVALAGPVRRNPMPSALEAAELLDVDMDQLTRLRAFIAAHGFGRIQGRDAIEPQAAQDTADGRRRNAEIAGDLLAGEALPAQRLDRRHRRGRGGAIQAMRP